MFEVYESSKYIHLLLPYLEGGELFERIKAKGLYKESDAVKVMRNFLDALKYLAEKNIVHRDLKPENLILANKGDDHDLRIADFGLAQILSEDEKTLYLRCGSPGYVAPELLDDRGYDTQADVFSAGVIMYVMLTGRPLFRGNNVTEILEKNKNCILEFPQQYWDKISEDAKNLVQGLLKADPNERLTAAQALQHDWFTKGAESD